MAERQRHGNDNETYCYAAFDLQKTDDINYTSPWDARTKTGVATSLKTHKVGNIELGDYFRQANVKEDFYFIARMWDGRKNNIVEELKYLIPHERWVALFSEAATERISHVFDGITNSREDDEKWKIRLEETKKFVEENSKNVIKVYFKRDHKNQKRVQCGITPKLLNEYFGDCVVDTIK